MRQLGDEQYPESDVCCRPTEAHLMAVATQAPPLAPQLVPGATPSPFHLIPAARSEGLIVVGMMVILLLDQPAKWFANRAGGSTVGGNVMSLMIIAVMCYGLLNVSLRFDRYFELLFAEPLMPLLLGLMAASSLWSSDPAKTLDTTVALAGVTAIGMWLHIRFPLSTIVGFAAITAFIAATICMMFVVFLPRYGVGQDGWMGALPNRNLLGRNSTMGFAISLVAFRVHRRWRLPLLVPIGLNLALVIGAQSKTSFVGSVAVLGMVIILPTLRATKTLYGAVSLVFIGIVGGLSFLVYGNLASLSQALGREANLTGRTEIWPSVINSIRDQPWFGYGWNGFWTGWTGPGARVWKEIRFEAAHAHNGPLEVALGIGLVGMCIFLAIYIRAAVRGARVMRYYASPVGMFPLIVVSVVVSASVTEFGILVHDFVYLMFTIAVFAVSRGRKDALAGVPKPTRHSR
jgi:O-antigen ligase